MKKIIESAFSLSDTDKITLMREIEEVQFMTALPDAFRKLQADFNALKVEFDTLKAEHENLKKLMEAGIIGQKKNQLAIGEIVTFGNYDWLVIQNTGVYLTLLCKEIICQMLFYQSSKNGFAWTVSSLRAWLNSEFFNTFTEEEKSNIICGQGISDKVYLLSRGEAERVKINILSCNSWWWLRSIGKSEQYAAGVNPNGSIDYSGIRVSGQGGVRPAITIRI